MEREVRCGECDVLEKRGIPVFLVMLLEALDRVVSDRGGGVVVRRGFRGDGLVVEGGPFDGEVIVLLAEDEGVVEAVLQRFPVDVPFAAVVAAVAVAAQKIGEQARPALSGALSAAAESGQRVSVDLLCVESGERCGAGGPASCGVVEAGVAQSIRCELIEVWCIDLPAVTA